MKKTLYLWQLLGFGLTSVLGTLLHFLYDLTGGSPVVAPFSAINESTWEHMKLIFWPMLVFAFVQSFFFKDQEDFPCIKLRGILTALTLIPTLFYTYNGVIGKSPDWVNIGIFFVSAAVAFIYETLLFKKETKSCSKVAAVLCLCILAAAFVLFTFFPPSLGVFVSPI